MGIRTDSDLQQPSVADGHNPYTDEDLAPYRQTYTPSQIDMMCEQQEDIARLFEETSNLVTALSAAIERLSPIISDVYANLAQLQEVIDNDTASQS